MSEIRSSTSIYIATPSPPPQIFPISSHTHLPIKLTTTNYPIWRQHLLALLNGHNLAGYVNGKIRDPSVTGDESLVTAAHWYPHDQLLLAAILGSLATDVQPLISLAATSEEAWNILARSFASTSRQRVLQLKTALSRASIRSRTITEYVNFIKAKADELSLIDDPVNADDLTLYVVNGLGSEYESIVGPIVTRETPLKFEELRDHLVEHERRLRNREMEQAQLVATANVAGTSSSSYRPQTRGGGSGNRGHYNNSRGGGRHQNHHPNYPNQGQAQSFHHTGQNKNRGGRSSNNSRPPVFYQLCGYSGHTAPYCRNQPPLMAHMAFYPQGSATVSPWLVDSGASHNLTNDLGNMTVHSEYDGTDEIQIVDGSGLPITHTGSNNGGASSARTM